MSDPLVIALTRLCGGKGRQAAARRAEVADQLGVNEQTLYQIISGVKLSSGRERTVGRELREKLDRHFPGWLTPEDVEQATPEQDPAAELQGALSVIRDNLVKLGGQSSVRAAEALRLLAMTPDSARAFNAALSALGGPGTDAAASDPPSLFDRQMARELALSITDDVRQAVVLDFLARLEREPERERQERNSGQSATALPGKIHTS